MNPELLNGEAGRTFAPALCSASWGSVSVRNSDCMEVMREYPDAHFDLAIVDPPYGIAKEKKLTVAKPGNKTWNTGGAAEKWDVKPSAEYFRELFRVSRNQIIWGGNYFLDHLRPTQCFISWDKMNGTNKMADFELAWTSFDSSCRRFSMHHFSDGYDKKIHPTQKPVKLYKWLLMKYAQPGQRILDTHLGSGSSAIAALDMKFELLGCEIDSEYFAAAVERIGRYESQGTFDMTPN